MRIYIYIYLHKLKALNLLLFHKLSDLEMGLCDSEMGT